MPTGIFVRTEKHRRNISIALTGKPKSKMARFNMSIAKMGYMPIVAGWNSGIFTRERRYCIFCKAELSKGAKFTCNSHLSDFRKGKPGSVRGERHGSWKGGKVPLNEIIRHSLEYKAWRRNVFERDDFRCFDCGTRGGRLEAHHIYPFSLFERLRFFIENGLTLCKPCHQKRK